jgi:hypothetical protein
MYDKKNGGGLLRGFEQIEKALELIGEKKIRKVVQFYYHKF